MCNMFLLICLLLYTLGTVMEMEEKYKKFGLDRNELYNSYVSVQKIVWEQYWHYLSMLDRYIFLIRKSIPSKSQTYLWSRFWGEINLNLMF
jgi:hypothetical protein